MESTRKMANQLMLKSIELSDTSIYPDKTGLVSALYLYAHSSTY